jgi:hypothetical protein
MTLQLLLPSRRAWPCNISCSTTCVYQSAAAQKYARCLHHADYMWCLALAFEALKVMNGVFWLLLLDQRFSAKCLPHPPASYQLIIFYPFFVIVNMQFVLLDVSIFQMYL